MARALYRRNARRQARALHRWRAPAHRPRV